MALRRMFSMKIVDTDAFLDMPLSTQALYFHLAMRADDDGFVSNPKKIVRMLGVQEDELKVLFAKKFIIGFENGVVVIKHWKIHNYIQNDRYTPTTYTRELAMLGTKDNGGYTLDTERIQIGDTGKVRIGKDRLGKLKEDSETSSLSISKNKHFLPPSIKEVSDYCLIRKNNIDASAFVDHYTANGWMRGKSKIKDWQACVRTWEKNNRQTKSLNPDLYE